MRGYPREQIGAGRLPGRTIQSAVGREAFSPCAAMTVGFARYPAESGPMKPHRQVEEVVFVLDAKNGWARFGPAEHEPGERIALEAGRVLHNPTPEWPVFGYDERGFGDIVFVHGRVGSIRPEQIPAGWQGTGG